MIRNKDKLVLAKIILASGIILFLLILSPQESMNRIGNIDNLNESASPDEYKYGLVQVNRSPDINAHQGIATDKNYFYLFHTDSIKKTDKNWNEMDNNRDVLSEIGDKINHLGDGDYHDGKLYVPVEYWDNYDNFRLQHIAVWNASDLSYIGKHDISDQNHEVAGITVDSIYIYIVSFYNGTAIWKYNLSNFSYAGCISLSKNIKNIQGITKKDDHFYISQENCLYKVSPTGTIVKETPTKVNEGIDIYQNILYCLNDKGKKEYIYSYKKSS